MEKSKKKIFKKIFNLYNLGIFACVAIISVALIILIEPDFSFLSNIKFPESKQSSSDVKIVEFNNSGKEISEKDAKKIAKNQFKELGEKNIKEDDLEVLKIKREEEEYYYISSSSNTVEINIKTGKITRINSVKVDK